MGSGLDSIPETTDEEQAKTLPQAVRYLKCSEGAENLCVEHQFNAKCWIPRDDVSPQIEQREHPQNQILRHPGFRQHRYKSRVFAHFILEMLEDALADWGDITIVGEYIWTVKCLALFNIRFTLLIIMILYCYF